MAKLDREKCHGIGIIPENVIYPLMGWKSIKFFNPNITQRILNETADAMGFRIWSGRSTLHPKNTDLPMGKGHAYDIVAKEHCPLIYAQHTVF